MKFFAIVILPKAVDPSNTAMVELAVSELMQPFKMWEDDISEGEGHWDYYWCCTRDWMDQSECDYSAYAITPADQPLVIFQVEHLSASGVTPAVISPTGEWYQSKATYAKEDHSWEPVCLTICSSFPGHLAILVYCHG